MFDLEKAVSDWRGRIAADLKSGANLEELESHLREDFGALLSKGMPEAEAFELAAFRLGSSRTLKMEFEKLEVAASVPGVRPWWWAELLIVFLCIFIGYLGAFRADPILAAHFITLTTGYVVGFITGCIGIYYLCSEFFGWLKKPDRRLIHRAPLYSRLSLGLVTAGLALGMLWNKARDDQWWEGNPRETAALAVIFWLFGLVLAQRSRRMSERRKMSLCVCCNIVVSWAWFGAGILSNVNGLERYWPLIAFWVFHMLLLAIGTPQSAAAEE